MGKGAGEVFETGSSKRERVRAGWVILVVGLVAVVVSAGAPRPGEAFFGEDKGEAVAISTIELPSFTELTKRYGPAVVNISANQTVKSGEMYHQFKHPFDGQQMDPFDLFKFFGVPPQQREYKRRSLGSGFIISEDGYILTNHHVVEEAEDIKVILYEEEEYEAEVKGRDPRTDLALIKIDAKDLPTVVMGDSDKLEVGEWVLAIGNPLGFGHTVTTGIVSAKGRNLGLTQYEDFIQTDASINPGNSGGPLFNMRGEVVGINSAIASTTGGSIGIGFAIPVNMAKNVIDQLKEKGKVVRGWLGVIIQKIDKEKMEAFGLESDRGALVSQVVEEGPAKDAGLKLGDVIVEFEGMPVDDFDDLPPMVANTSVGTKTTVKVIRDGREKTFTVKLGELPDEPELAKAIEDEGESLGLRVHTMTPEMAARLGVGEDVKGVVVTEVEAESPAEKANLRPGDIVIEVNRKQVENAAGFAEEIGSAPAGKIVLLLVRRGRNTIFVTLKKPKS